MEFFADFHTHSTHSDGRGTLKQNALAAQEKGLSKLGFADHGPRNIGVGVKSAETYLDIKKEIQDLALAVPQVELLVGAEADVTSMAGAIDVPPKIARELDFLIVGLHPYVWTESLTDFANIVVGNQLAQFSKGIKERVRTRNTKALIECIHKNEVFCISHPDLKMPVDIAELGNHCANKGVALEINTGHRYNKNDLVKEALPTGVNFVVSSDAHFPTSIGQFVEGELLLKRHNVPVERVLNARL